MIITGIQINNDIMVYKKNNVIHISTAKPFLLLLVNLNIQQF